MRYVCATGVSKASDTHLFLERFSSCRALIKPIVGGSGEPIMPFSDLRAP